MKNLDLVIDEQKCISCGLCIKDCVGSVLEFNENKFPKVAKDGEKKCIKCQHCLAVCPTGALSIFNKDPQNSDFVKKINPEDVLNLIKTRRSFRQFKNENVPSETIEQLKKALDYVPTGCNARALKFNFIDKIDEMDKYRNYCIEKLKNFAWLMPKKFSNYKQSILAGDDVIFRNAPHMLIVSVDRNAPCKDIDPIIALSYFDLYAQSLGLGTLWCGFADIAFKFFKKMRKNLKLEKNYKIGYVMLFGIPSIKYQRAIQPESYIKQRI